jgi:hypothetical protein
MMGTLVESGSYNLDRRPINDNVNAAIIAPSVDQTMPRAFNVAIIGRKHTNDLIGQTATEFATSYASG